jgi:hypothetical protein
MNEYLLIASKTHQGRSGTQITTAIKFSLRPTAETLADLSRPIDLRYLKKARHSKFDFTESLN